MFHLGSPIKRSQPLNLLLASPSLLISVRSFRRVFPWVPSSPTGDPGRPGITSSSSSISLFFMSPNSSSETDSGSILGEPDPGPTRRLCRSLKSSWSSLRFSSPSTRTSTFLRRRRIWRETLCFESTATELPFWAATSLGFSKAWTDPTIFGIQAIRDDGVGWNFGLTWRREGGWRWRVVPRAGGGALWAATRG